MILSGDSAFVCLRIFLPAKIDEMSEKVVKDRIIP